MKKTLLLFCISFILSYTSSAQNQISYIYPFGQDTTRYILMSRDTIGDMWYCYQDDDNDSVHITNHNNTTYYSFLSTGGGTGPGIDNFFVDSRNDIWVTNIGGIAYRISNGVIQVLPSAEHTNPVDPFVDSSYYEMIAMADDHHGNNYFFSYHSNYWDFGQTPDSFYVTKFDGTNFTQTNLTSLGINFETDMWTYTPYPNLICDYAGNVYVFYDTVQILKYNGTTWTSIPFPFDGESIYEVFIDRSNNIYFNDHGQNIFKLRTNYTLQTLYNHGAGNILVSNLFGGNDGSLWFNDPLKFYKWNNSSFVLIADLGYLSCYDNEGAVFDKYGRILVSGYGNTCGVLVYTLPGFTFIEGSVFFDTDADGQFDTGENGVPGQNVIQTRDNYVANTDNNGFYSVLTLDSTVSTPISLTAPNYYHFTTPPAYSAHPDSSTCCYSFGLAPDGNIQDLQLSVTSQFAVPGFTSMVWLCYKNVGTTTVSNTISYTFDPLLTYVSSTPAPTSVNGNTLTWSYSSLQPFEQRNIAVTLHLDSSVALGTILTDSAVVYSLQSDTTPADNKILFLREVIGAFDPNEKAVSRTNLINPGEPLDYTVFFQNTGTLYATNVVVRDTLSEDLDWSSFKITGSSHPMTYQLKANGIVEFRFMNIMLPDSNTDEPGSHGFVKYTINVKSNTFIGANIRNTAFIYFDFNSPIATNTTNSFIGVSGILDFGEAQEFKVYPNPSSDEFWVEATDNNRSGNILLTDLTGRIISINELKQDVQKVSVRGLPSGLYLLGIIKNGVVVARTKIVVKQ